MNRIGLALVSPADDEAPELVIAEACESVFAGTVNTELAQLIYDARDVLARVARGEPVGTSDAFARLIREAEHLHTCVDEEIAREQQRDDDIAEEMRDFYAYGFSRGYA